MGMSKRVEYNNVLKYFHCIKKAMTEYIPDFCGDIPYDILLHSGHSFVSRVSVSA